MPSEPSDLYSLLGVAPSATADAIRRAYRSRARELHPDLAGATADADSRMAELNAAWAVLRDPVKKGRYDRSLDLGLDSGLGPGADRGPGATDDGPGFAAGERGTAHAAPRPAAAPPGRHRGASRALGFGRVVVALSLAAGAPVAGFGFAAGAPTLVVLGFALLLIGAVGTATLVLLAMRPGRSQVRRGRARQVRRGRARQVRRGRARQVRRGQGSPTRRRSR